MPDFIICCSPKTMFIMGGGEGSAAREALRHKSMEKVVMCDIDEVDKICIFLNFSGVNLSLVI